MSKRIADKGSSEMFLRAVISAQTDDCILWPFRLNDRGYGLAVINGKQRTASNWMCRLAHGEPKGKRKHASHSCGNPACVNHRHIRWATHKENMHDKRKHGTEIIGERNGKTHLTENDVRYIRDAPANLAVLEKKFGMSKGGISKIRSGNRWSHVK